MKKESLHSRYRELMQLLKHGRRAGKRPMPLEDILSQTEMAAMQAYLRCRSYEKAAAEMRMKRLMVYISISNAIDKIRLWKQLAGK